MATIASRLTNTGTLSISGEFDEVTVSTIRLTPDNLFSSEFDEVTINPVSNGIAKRETATGQILVAQELDEVNKPT